MATSFRSAVVPQVNPRQYIREAERFPRGRPSLFCYGHRKPVVAPLEAPLYTFNSALRVSKPSGES